MTRLGIRQDRYSSVTPFHHSSQKILFSFSLQSPHYPTGRENEPSSHQHHSSQLLQLHCTCIPWRDVLQKTLTTVKYLPIIELISVQWKSWAANQATDSFLSFALHKINFLIPPPSPTATDKPGHSDMTGLANSQALLWCRHTVSV